MFASWSAVGTHDQVLVSGGGRIPSVSEDDLMDSFRRRRHSCRQLLGPAPPLMLELVTLFSQPLGLPGPGISEEEAAMHCESRGRNPECSEIRFPRLCPGLLSTALPGRGIPARDNGAEDREDRRVSSHPPNCPWE